jgi:hypothetical protein
MEVINVQPKPSRTLFHCKKKVLHVVRVLMSSLFAPYRMTINRNTTNNTATCLYVFIKIINSSESVKPIIIHCFLSDNVSSFNLKFNLKINYGMKRVATPTRDSLTEETGDPALCEPQGPLARWVTPGEGPFPGLRGGQTGLVSHDRQPV